MGKRFTATEKWDDPAYLSLSAETKILWQYLCDKCDQSGVIKFAAGIAIFFLSGKEDIPTNLKKLEMLGWVEWLDATRLWLPKFISFQNGKLTEKCPAHRPIFSLVEKHGLIDRVLIGYQYPTGKGKSKGKGNGNTRAREDSVSEDSDFEQFWKAYPKQVGYEEAKVAWNETSEKRPPIQVILDAVKAQRKSKQWLENGGQFVPDPATWLRAGRWSDVVDGAKEKPVQMCGVCNKQPVSIVIGNDGFCGPVCRKKVKGW